MSTVTPASQFLSHLSMPVLQKWTLVSGQWANLPRSMQRGEVWGLHHMCMVLYAALIHLSLPLGFTRIKPDSGSSQILFPTLSSPGNQDL